MTFFWTVKLIAGIGSGLWFGHWSARRFGRWGTAIALVAFVAAVCAIAWAKDLIGSDERIMSRDGDAAVYRVETPDRHPCSTSYGIIPAESEKAFLSNAPAGEMRVTTPLANGEVATFSRSGCADTSNGK